MATKSKAPAPKVHERGRDAGSGRFEPVAKARQDKGGAVVEKVKPRKK